jgi:hypothetical protein
VRHRYFILMSGNSLCVVLIENAVHHTGVERKNQRQIFTYIS